MVDTAQAIDQINRFEVGNFPYRTELVRFVGGEMVTKEVTLEQVTIERGDYERALDEINETYGAIEDPDTGKQYEIAIVNSHVPAEEGFDVEFATERSSLTNNPGNAPEFAANSAVHPGRKRIYVAAPGNGLSSDFDPQEHRYIRRTGRLIGEDGEPLPTFAGLPRAMEAAGLLVDPIIGKGIHFTGNSAGGAYAKGLMVALESGSVTRGYAKNIPGVTNHRLGLLWTAAAFGRDILDDMRSSKRSHDQWKLTPEIVKEAVARLPRIYGPDSHNRQQTKPQQAVTSHTPNKLITTAMMLARGGAAKDHPAAADTAAVLDRHPGALITNHFSLYDRLYSNRRDMHQFLEQVHRLGGLATDNRVEIVVMIMSGTHRDHTAYPHMRWAAETRAFAREE